MMKVKFNLNSYTCFYFSNAQSKSKLKCEFPTYSWRRWIKPLNQRRWNPVIIFVSPGLIIFFILFYLASLIEFIFKQNDVTGSDNEIITFHRTKNSICLSFHLRFPSVEIYKQLGQLNYSAGPNSECLMSP